MKLLKVFGLLLISALAQDEEVTTTAVEETEEPVVEEPVAEEPVVEDEQEAERAPFDPNVAGFCDENECTDDEKKTQEVWDALIVNDEPITVSQSIDPISTDVEITDAEGATSTLTVTAKAEQKGSYLSSKAWVDGEI